MIESHPKYYLISESELSQWQTVTPISPTCQELRERVRSRPYTSAEKMLDELEERGHAIAEIILETHIPAIWISDFDSLIAELRQAQR